MTSQDTSSLLQHIITGIHQGCPVPVSSTGMQLYLFLSFLPPSLSHYFSILFSLSLSLFLSFSLDPFFSVSVSFSVYLTLSTTISLFLSLSLLIYLFFSQIVSFLSFDTSMFLLRLPKPFWYHGFYIRWLLISLCAHME